MIKYFLCYIGIHSFTKWDEPYDYYGKDENGDINFYQRRTCKICNLIEERWL